jgi:hypothetical protein
MKIDRTKIVPYMLRRWVLWLACVAGLAPLACLGPQNVKTLPAEPETFKVATVNERIFPGTLPGGENPLLVNPETRNIHLYGAGGETVAFQVIVPPQDGAAASLIIEPMVAAGADGNQSPSPTPTIDQSRWRVYQVLNVPVTSYDAYDARLISPAFLSPQSYPDPLAPLMADASGHFSVPGNLRDSTLLWVEVDIPQQAISTEYSGTIRLEWPSKKMSRSVKLRTWGFDLPSPGVDVFGLVDVPKIWLEHGIGSLRESDRLILPPDQERTEKLAELVGQYVRLLDENGVEPWLTNVYPKMAGTDPASIYIDWAGYGRLVQAVLKNSSRARQYWPMPADLSYPSTQMYGPYSTGLYQQILKNYLRQFNETFVRPGLIGKPVAVPVWSDSYEQSVAVYPSSTQWAREIHQVDSSPMIVHPFMTTDLRPMGWPGFKPFDQDLDLAGAVCPEEKWLDPTMIATFREQGKAVWWRLAESDGTLPTLRITYPTYFSQALAWTGQRYDSSGVMLGNINNWPVKREQAVNDYGRWTGNVLIYPGQWFGSDKPLASIRLKMIKRGLQDIAYMKALKNAGRGELADWLARHLVRFAHADAFDGSVWTLRNDGLCNQEQAWMLPSVIAGLELDLLARQKKISTQPTTTSTAPTTQQVLVENDRLMEKLYKSQFRQFTQGISVESQGVRARNITDIKTGQQEVEWSFNLVTRSFTDGVDQATIGFGNIAPPIVASRGSDKLTGLSWAWPVRSILKLESPGVAMGLFGVNSQNVRLKLKDNSEMNLECRYCALAGSKLGRMARIDGLFDDWPDTPSAIAGDFVRIRSDGINDQRFGAIDRRVQRPTQVQIGYDEQNLYLAFTCYEPQEQRSNKPTNTVESSAGLPWGEDLVAIVLDPDNTGSLNPLDAYQVIVKANGNVLTFRGTLEASNMNASQSWPNHVRAAVAVFPDRWQAEVCIPLADVKAMAKLNRWWGIDFARMSAAMSEFSTWSGTASQYTCPVSMGNLFLAK